MRLHRLSSLGRAAVASAFTVLLAACGGGISFSVGGGDDLPSVSLAANVSDAAPGGPVRLVAAAASARRIDQVIFFQLDDGSGTQQLGSDATAPYEWIAVVPAQASAQVRYVARAVDDLGRFADSNVVTVRVR